MKPAPFEYLAPTATSEAVGLLHQWGSDAKVLSGGQSLMPMLNFRLLKPAALVDINGIGGLAYIRQVDSSLSIGATTRQNHILASPDAASTCGLLTEALTYVAHPAIRNRGTIGGSIAHADPSAELAVVAATLEADLRLQSVRGERVLAAEDFFVDALTTALAPDELITEIRFPALPTRTGWNFQEVSRRRGDFAVVNAAATVSLDESGRCERVRVVVRWRKRNSLAAENAGRKPDRYVPDFIVAGRRRRPGQAQRQPPVRRSRLIRIPPRRGRRPCQARPGNRGTTRCCLAR